VGRPDFKSGRGR